MSGIVSDLCVSSLSDPLAPETCLTTDGTTVSNEKAAVTPDGNTVVWQKCVSPSNSCDIYISGRDGATGGWGSPRLLIDSGASDLRPDTDGRFVTWTTSMWLPEEQRLDCSVYYMDLTTTAGAQPISVGKPDCQSNAQISRGVVIFDRGSGDGATWDIYLADLSTRTTYMVRDTALHEFLPDVSHDAAGKVWLTWSQEDRDRNESADVWAMRIDLASSQYAVQPLFNQSRSHKAGSVVPIRLQLLAAAVNVSSPSLVLTATGLVQKDSTAAPQLVEDAGNANPDSEFRFDQSLQGYVFNLSTKNLAAGTWELRFMVGGDTREYRVAFDVR